MRDTDFRNLVNKYALLLLVGFALGTIITKISIYAIPYNYESTTLKTIFYSIPTGVNIIINIIAAILVSKDMKRYNLYNNLIIVMTLFFSLIGVTMFFITANREIKNIS